MIGIDPWIGKMGHITLSNELRKNLNRNQFFSPGDCGEIDDINNGKQIGSQLNFLG